MKNNIYYNIENDFNMFPDAWCFIVIGGRATGKTYSALKSCLLNEKKFIFLKRTIEDIDLLCAGTGKLGADNSDFGFDLSPFKSINRDLGTDVHAYTIKKGIGGFWKELNGDPQGAPIGYLLALNAVSKYKGFDLSECDYQIFDEFIPNTYDRVNRKEGEQVLDLYKTVARDREERGREPLKLVCLANATSINNPTMSILEIVDNVADMQANNKELLYLEERGIVIHILPDNSELVKKQKESVVYKALGHTAWGQMSFDNSFAYNDFTNIGRTSLKGYKPYCAVSYKTENYYIYEKDGFFYMCRSRSHTDNIYNLNLENDQKRFFYDEAIDLKEYCINGQMLFESYTMYDLIINYRKFFNL